jgi:YesN/AraC family two-component response regulator
MSRFVYLFIPVIVLWGVELLRIFLDIPDAIGIVVAINWGIIFILLYYVSFKAFSQSDLFLDFVPIDERVKTIVNASKIMAEIEEVMTREGYYKNPDLNLHDLSKMMDLGARKLSESIKENNDCNFATWVNTHRVNAAIKLIREDSNLSLEGIGQEVGFKSRSAMYNAFKKIKGATPGDFKR